jgi:hypothetical protein
MSEFLFHKEAWRYSEKFDVLPIAGPMPVPALAK